MTQATRDLVREALIKVVPFALALGAAWGSLKAEVSHKADKSAVAADHTLLVEMNARQQKIEHILCTSDHIRCDGVQP